MSAADHETAIREGIALARRELWWFVERDHGDGEWGFEDSDPSLICERAMAIQDQVLFPLLAALDALVGLARAKECNRLPAMQARAEKAEQEVERLKRGNPVPVVVGAGGACGKHGVYDGYRCPKCAPYVNERGNQERENQERETANAVVVEVGETDGVCPPGAAASTERELGRSSVSPTSTTSAERSPDSENQERETPQSGVEEEASDGG